MMKINDQKKKKNLGFMRVNRSGGLEVNQFFWIDPIEVVNQKNDFFIFFFIPFPIHKKINWIHLYKFNPSCPRHRKLLENLVSTKKCAEKGQTCRAYSDNFLHNLNF